VLVWLLWWVAAWLCACWWPVGGQLGPVGGGQL